MTRMEGGEERFLPFIDDPGLDLKQNSCMRKSACIEEERKASAMSGLIMAPVGSKTESTIGVLDQHILDFQ